MNKKLIARNTLEQTPYAERVAKYRAAFQLLRAKAQPQKCLSRGDWIKYVLSVHRICQVEAFAEIEHNLTDEQYWRLLGHVLWNGENHGIYRDLYLYLMRSPRPRHLLFMTLKQLQEWEALPEEILIFRGHGQQNKYGFWFSLSAMTAAGVASSYGAEGQVSAYLVSKHDCFFLGGKYESVLFIKGLADIHA